MVPKDFRKPQCVTAGWVTLVSRSNLDACRYIFILPLYIEVEIWEAQKWPLILFIYGHMYFTVQLSRRDVSIVI